nr:hypothetical protein GCM10020093_091650 [Planobispora longispora]
MLPELLGFGWAGVLALPYGILISWGGRRLAGNLGFTRYPEILGAISRPA